MCFSFMNTQFFHALHRWYSRRWLCTTWGEKVIFLPPSSVTGSTSSPLRIHGARPHPLSSASWLKMNLWRELFYRGTYDTLFSVLAPRCHSSVIPSLPLGTGLADLLSSTMASTDQNTLLPLCFHLSAGTVGLEKENFLWRSRYNCPRPEIFARFVTAAYCAIVGESSLRWWWANGHTFQQNCLKAGEVGQGSPGAWLSASQGWGANPSSWQHLEKVRRVAYAAILGLSSATSSG